MKTQQIPLNKIILDDKQIRGDGLDMQGIQNLAHSIQSCGLINPVVVYPAGKGRYKMIAGERRAVAAGWARDDLNGGDSITAIVYPKKPDATTIEDIQFAENMHRADLAAHEVIAWTLRRFQAFEKTEGRKIKVADIEGIMSLSQRQAYKYLGIYKADRVLVEALIDPAIASDFNGLNDYIAAINQKPAASHQDEQNQKEESRAGQGGGFKLNLKYTNPLAIQSLILKNSTAKQRKQYAQVDWQSPRATSAAFRAFLADWESKV